MWKLEEVEWDYWLKMKLPSLTENGCFSSGSVDCIIYIWNPFAKVLLTKYLVPFAIIPFDNQISKEVW